MLNSLFVAWASRQQRQESEMLSDRAGRVAAQARSQVELLEADVERLFMIVEALWTVLKEQHGLSDEALAQRIQAIDMKDGRLDGKVASQAPLKCPKCGRPVSSRHFKCLYCGASVSAQPFHR